MDLDELRQSLFEVRPDVEEEYHKYDLAFEVGMMIKEARIVKGLTQEALARALGSKQPAIARWESGKSLPSLGTLNKIAKVLGTYLISPKFAMLDNISISIGSNDSSTISNDSLLSKSTDETIADNIKWRNSGVVSDAVVYTNDSNFKITYNHVKE